MKSMKKLLVVFLALLISVMGLTGCKKAPKPAPLPEEIEQIGDELSSAFDELSEALEEASQELGSANEQIQEELSSAQEEIQEVLSSEKEEIEEKFSTEITEEETPVETITVEETEPETETETEPEPETEALLDKDGAYFSKDEVALYIHQYGELPDNFITKKQAQKLGWEGGALESYAPGKAIGGSYFGNYEEVLPENEYHECDIDTKGKKRGAKRIVYSEDGFIYYTEDHYETFTLIYTPDGPVTDGEVYGGK